MNVLKIVQRKTLWPYELRIIAALFVMCKLFTVIIGTFIERCKALDMDRNLIETHCVSIFKYVLRKDDMRTYLTISCMRISMILYLELLSK